MKVIHDFCYDMKLVSPKDLGLWEFEMSKCWKLSIHILFNTMLGNASCSSGTDQQEEEASSSSPQKIMDCTNTFKYALIFLKVMVNEHVFMNLMSLSKKFSPHRF